MHRLGRWGFVGLMVACDASPAADAAAPVTVESAGRPIAEPIQEVMPPRGALQPRKALQPRLPVTPGTCDVAEPAHILTATPEGLELDGERVADVAAIAAGLNAASGGEALALALAFDEGMTRKELDPLLSALARLAPPPRLAVRVGSSDPLAGARHVPIAGIADEAPADPTRSLEGYLLVLDGRVVRVHDLVEPAREVPNDIVLAGLPVLVTASPYTQWGTIARHLERSCGGARLVEKAELRGTRVPTITRAGLASMRPPQSGGHLDRDVIRRIVRAHIHEVRGCYDIAMKRDPQARGRVAIRFTIAASGKVSDSAVAESNLADADVGPCIAAAVRRWKFPRPEGGSVELTYPFVLEPG